MVDIEPPEPTPEEQLQLKVEMDRLVKSLPERKRRTFLRFMKKGKEIEKDDDEGKSFVFSFCLFVLNHIRLQRLRLICQFQMVAS